MVVAQFLQETHAETTLQACMQKQARTVYSHYYKNLKSNLCVIVEASAASYCLFALPALHLSQNDEGSISEVFYPRGTLSCF